MKIKKYRILLILILAIFIVLILQNNSNAALSIGSSKSTVSPGETFSVTVSISSNEAGAVTLSVSNGTLSSTHIDLMSQSSVTVSCTAGNSGTVYISGSGTVANYTTETEGTQSASKSISIIAPVTPTVADDPEVVDTKPAPTPKTTTNKPTKKTEEEEVKKSNDATLKELIAAEGAISPEFNPETKEYTLSVPNEITALNITATQNDSKATVKIEGNSDLKVGENKVTITVVAEDATTYIYTINVTRQRMNISLTSLKITYMDKDGNIQELLLTPTFDPAVLEYNLEELSYLIDSLDIKAIANLENAIVEIKGNENLVEGQNTITITITMKAEPALEGEEQLPDEVVVYTINVAKQAKLTFWQKVKNWFGGIAGTISTFYNDNQGRVTLGALVLCIVALLGLSIYIIIDFNKYRRLIQKLKEINTLNTETVADTGINAGVTLKAEDNGTVEIQNIEEKEEIKDDNLEEKTKIGKHF